MEHLDFGLIRLEKTQQGCESAAYHSSTIVG